MGLGHFVVIPSKESFIGRVEELLQLHELTKKRFQPILVTGPPGIGKTALVLVYIARNYPSEEIAWLELEKTPDPNKFLHEYIEQLHQPSGRAPSVVALDGVERLSSNELETIFHRLFNFKRVQAVIGTTRPPASRLKQAKYLELSRLSFPDIVSFLHKNIKQPISDEELARLATAIKGNPLALTIIVNFLRDHLLQEVWSFLEGDIYNLESASTATPKQLIKIVQPQIVVATDSLIRRLQKVPTDLYKISPRQFEEIIADLLSDMGWDVELTKQTRDGGKDILAYTETDLGRILCLVEAKRHRRDRPVGIGIVKTLLGTFCDHPATSAMLVTTSHFSDDAKELEERHKYQLSLRDYAGVVEWIKKYKMH
jgi:restriction system protein